MANVTIVAELVGSAAVGVGLLVTAGYRWATTRSPPAGTAVLVALSTVAGYHTYTAITAGSFFDGVALDQRFTGGYLLATVLVAGLAATAGAWLGDRIACQVAGVDRIDADGDAADAVRSARLAVDVELPDAVEDADGYRPVDRSVRRALAGATVRLPHGLSPARRRDRIERHVTADYDVDYADVTLADDGSVTRLLVGRRADGLGSMLPPNAVAAAIRAVCAPDASLGDPVEIWSNDDRTRLIATGTLHSSGDGVATVLVDADHVGDLAADDRYRLVTHPDDPTDGYEFASTLRTVDETVTTLSVDDDGPLDGEFAGWVPGRVLVVDRDGDLLAVPADNETLRAGDELWVLTPPDDLTSFDPASSAATVGDST